MNALKFQSTEEYLRHEISVWSGMARDGSDVQTLLFLVPVLRSRGIKGSTTCSVSMQKPGADLDPMSQAA